MRTHRSRGRILRQAQALSQRGFLYGTDLSIDGLSHDHVSGSVRDSAHFRLDRAMAGNAARSRTKNRATAPGLSGSRYARLRSHRKARLGRIPPGAWPVRARRVFTLSRPAPHSRAVLRYSEMAATRESPSCPNHRKTRPMPEFAAA